MQSTIVVLIPVLLFSAVTAVQTEESLQEVMATSCVQDMSCEREPVDPAEFKWVRASSTLKGTRKNPKRYAATRAVDIKEKTAWCEGKAKSGLGERLVIKLKKPLTIDGVLVSPLFAKSIPAAKKNNRITAYILDFGVRAIRVKSAAFIIDVCGPPPNSCPELNAPQQVSFPALKTDSITLTIEKVERGAEYDDTCVSTLRLLKPDQD
jgi:hypothetical protein